MSLHGHTPRQRRTISKRPRGKSVGKRRDTVTGRAAKRQNVRRRTTRRRA